MVWRFFKILSSDTANQLEECLDEIADPSFEPWFDSCELFLMEVLLTRSVLALLVQILNQSLPKVPIATELRWDEVVLEQCSFARRQGCSTDLDVNDQDFCSEDDIQIFTSALARRTSSLQVANSPEILECLFNTLKCDWNELLLIQKRLSALECTRIGRLVESCGVSLKELYLHIDYFEEPFLFGESLANASHLQQISFNITNRGSGILLLDVLIQDCGNCILRPLLSPPSRLQN